MFDVDVLVEPPDVVVVLHPTLTHVVVQVPPEHTVRCVVLCVRALAVDVNISTCLNYLDCKISAYPKYVEWQGINRQAPSLIFIEDKTPPFFINFRCLKKPLSSSE